MFPKISNNSFLKKYHNTAFVSQEPMESIG